MADSTSGLSRQFAFAQFATVPDAKSFYDTQPPSIQFLGTYGEDEEKRPYVTIAYSREKEERALPGQSENDWICNVV